MNNLPTVTNLLINERDENEIISILQAATQAKLEHIVSHGEASAEGFWYDQEQAEWVCLIQGKAQLEFEMGVLELVAGDALTIPAHCKHRVSQVSHDAVWLALHFNS